MEEIFYIVRTDLKGATVKRQQEVARACGLAWSTLRRIVDGDENIRYSTIQKLRAYYLAPRTVTPPQAAQQAAHSFRRRQQMG